MVLTFHLTQNDSVAAMLARIRSAPPKDDGIAQRVLFVVPHGLRLSEIDLRLLRREAAAAGVQLALITSEPALRARAAREGISTFRSEERARRARWRRLSPRPPLAGGRQLETPPPGEADVVAPYGAGIFARRSPTKFRPVAFDRAYVRRPSPWWATLTLALALTALLAALVGAFVLVIPSATITLSPSAETTRVAVALRAVQNAEADPVAGIVPARVISTQVSGEGRTQTTGRSQEAAGKARGQALFINRTAAPLTVPAGTVVSTATGNNAQFLTTLDAPLSPNGRAEVPIEAALPGPTGNVRAGTITRVEGPQALSLLVTNNAPTAGGTTAQVAIVTEADKERLQAEVFERLKEQAYDDLNQKLEPGSFIPPETVSYLALSPTFTPFVGEVSPDLFLNMSVQAVGLVVDTESGKAVALKRLQDSMPPGTRLISDTLRYIPGGITVEDAQTVGFSITADSILLNAIDAGAVRNAVLGLTPEEASRMLMERFQLAEPPDIHLGPDWLPYIVPTELPMVPWRIRVIVDWDTAAQMAQQR